MSQFAALIYLQEPKHPLKLIYIVYIHYYDSGCNINKYNHAQLWQQLNSLPSRYIWCMAWHNPQLKEAAPSCPLYFAVNAPSYSVVHCKLVLHLVALYSTVPKSVGSAQHWTFSPSTISKIANYAVHYIHLVQGKLQISNLYYSITDRNFEILHLKCCV